MRSGYEVEFKAKSNVWENRSALVLLSVTQELHREVGEPDGDIFIHVGDESSAKCLRLPRSQYEIEPNAEPNLDGETRTAPGAPQRYT
jgi:hypothetical protein